MVKVVVLDVDGTLMDTNYLHTEAWARAFEKWAIGCRGSGSTRRSVKAQGF